MTTTLTLSLDEVITVQCTTNAYIRHLEATLTVEQQQYTSLR